MLEVNAILPKSLGITYFLHSLSLPLSHVRNDESVKYLNLDDLRTFHWTVVTGDLRTSVDEFRRLVADAKGIVRKLDRYDMIDQKGTGKTLEETGIASEVFISR